jgi:alpha-D-ribose 1-methylphosphonate 5-triphosphate synthase subunit PhnG
MNAADHDKGRNDRQAQRKAAMAVLAHATAAEIASHLAAISLPAH